MAEYRLVRASRKTIAITIDKNANVVVKAPLKCSNKIIEDFVNQKSEWIAKCVARQEQILAEAEQNRPEAGKTAFLLGNSYGIEKGSRRGFYGGKLYITDKYSPKEELVLIYKQIAGEYLKKRTAELAERLGVNCENVTITSAATRFGSCSGKNRISYTYKLIQADPWLIDYVVVHELCHIKQHNHSSRFWAEVEAAMPDYRARQAALRQFGAELAKRGF